MFYSKPWLDVLIVVAVVLLFFGPKRLPSIGRSLGEGMREFKDSITGKSGPEEEDERPAVPEASSQPVVPAPPQPAAQAPPAEQPVPAAPPEPQATAPTAPREESAAQSPPPVASSERRS